MQATQANDSPITYKRAFGILLPLCLLAVLLACFIIAVANDVYAFVKPDGQIVVSIPEPLTAKELSLLLQERGVIENPFIFRLYLVSKGSADKLASTVGEWTLNSSMSYREILLEIF